MTRCIHDLGAAATRQHGFVTTANLHDAGFDHSAITRLVRDGTLIRERRGLYALGHQAPSRERAMHRAVLAGGPSAVLTGPAAAELLGISRRRAGVIDVLVRRRCRPADGIRFHVHSSPLGDAYELHGVPIAPTPRVIRDCEPRWRNYGAAEPAPTADSRIECANDWNECKASRHSRAMPGCAWLAGGDGSTSTGRRFASASRQTGPTTTSRIDDGTTMSVTQHSRDAVFRRIASTIALSIVIPTQHWARPSPPSSTKRAL
jgi:hypothetical protein